MYVVNGMGDYLDPQVVAQGGMPRTPQTASMVMPRDSYFVTGGEAAAGEGGFSDLGAQNWAQWGQDMLTQGVKDTTGAVSYMFNRSGRTDTRTPSTTTPPEPTVPRPQEATLVPMAPAVMEKAGLPGWAWALIAVGGVAVLGGGAYFLFFRKG